MEPIIASLASRHGLFPAEVLVVVASASSTLLSRGYPRQL